MSEYREFLNVLAEAVEAGVAVICFANHEKVIWRVCGFRMINDQIDEIETTSDDELLYEYTQLLMKIVSDDRDYADRGTYVH